MGELGFVMYVGFLFLPGAGLFELLGLAREGDSLVARVGYSFGLGICVDTVVLLVRTSGLTSALNGIDPLTLYVVMAFGAAAFLASAAYRRRILLCVRPRNTDLILGALVLVQALVIALHFGKYPIFPEYPSVDFQNHVQLAQSLASGSSTSIVNGVLYYGVHLQLASALSLVGGLPLTTVRWTMAVLTLVSTPILYLAVRKVFSNETAAVIACVLYSLSATVWFVGVFQSGLYPNFFGVLASLFLVVAVLDAGIGPRSFGPWIVLPFAVVTAYYSHYSTLTLIPAIIVLPVVHYASKRQIPWRLVLGVLVLLAPGIAGAILDRNIVAILGLATTATANNVGSTTLSGVLAPFPFLRYIATEVADDVALIFLAALVGVYLWKIFSTKSWTLLFPGIWFLTLGVTAPLTESAWRYSYEAILPITLMAAFGLYSFLPRPERARRLRSERTSYWKVGLVLTLVVAPILVGSWGTKSVTDAVTDTPTSVQVQNQVNDTLVWLDANTPRNATFFSVSDWRFTLSSIFIGRVTQYSFLSTPAVAINYTRQNDIPYIIVTNYVTESLPPLPQLYPWNNFPTQSNSNLTLIYSNPDVRVYRVGQ